MNGCNIKDGNSFTFKNSNVVIDNTSKDNRSSINETINCDNGKMDISNIDISNTVTCRNSYVTLKNLNMNKSGCMLSDGTLNADNVTISDSYLGFSLRNCSKVVIENSHISHVFKSGINTTIGNLESGYEDEISGTASTIENMINAINKSKTPDDVIIKNTTINNCGTYGIKTANATITDSEVSLCQDSGIFCFYSKISDSRIECNNTSTRGGGICAPIGVTINKCKINNNHSGKSGGGVYAYDNLKINDSVINNNTAMFDGGAVHSFREVDIKNSKLYENSSNNCGGAIFADTLKAENLEIKDNNAENGGGIYVTNSDTVINNSTIQRNKAASQGGGIWCESNCSGDYTMTNIKVTENMAKGNGGGMYMECTTFGSADVVLGGRADVYGNTSNDKKNNLFLDTTTCKKAKVILSESNRILPKSSVGISTGTSQDSIDITAKYDESISNRLFSSDSSRYNINCYHGFCGGYYAELTT